MVATVIICIILVLIIALIIRSMVKKRKGGNGSCNCGCKDCQFSASCCGTVENDKSKS